MLKLINQIGLPYFSPREGHHLSSHLKMQYPILEIFQVTGKIPTTLQRSQRSHSYFLSNCADKISLLFKGPVKSLQNKLLHIFLLIVS